MRSDHLAKHVKTHNGTNGTTNPSNPTKKGSSESCSDSEEQNHNDLHQSPGNNNNNNNNPNNNMPPAGSIDGTGQNIGIHQQHNTMILTPHQINAPLLQHHHHIHHTPSPNGLDHVGQLDIKPGIV